jgi:hypothetical protein
MGFERDANDGEVANARALIGAAVPYPTREIAKANKVVV